MLDVVDEVLVCVISIAMQYFMICFLRWKLHFVNIFSGCTVFIHSRFCLINAYGTPITH